MRVIVSGASGFVGSEVLCRLIADPGVSGVTCLVRRPLGITSSKVDEVLVDDFTRYDDVLVAALAAHDGCIWTLGAKGSDITDPVLYERITHGFPLALAGGVAPLAARRFRFCFVSGMGVNRRERLVLPWERLTRRLKGRTERDLSALTAAHSSFVGHSFRPGGILPVDVSGFVRAVTAPIAVRVDELAAALVAVAKGDATAGDVLSNSQIKKLSRTRVPATS